jgi:O-antigen ligase
VHAAASQPAQPSRPIRDELLHGRLGIWGAAARTFADRPLHGAGADAFWPASRPHQEGRTTFYAHDLPLELAAELGVGGLLLALALYGAGGRLLWRARPGPAAWLLAPAAAAFLAANLVDWPWHFAGLGAIWAAACGFLMPCDDRSFAAQRVF